MKGLKTAGLYCEAFEATRRVMGENWTDQTSANQCSIRLKSQEET